jgi:hypothetical protein
LGEAAEFGGQGRQFEIWWENEESFQNRLLENKYILGSGDNFERSFNCNELEHDKPMGASNTFGQAVF